MQSCDHNVCSIYTQSSVCSHVITMFVVYTELSMQSCDHNVCSIHRAQYAVM